jgi:hypothetical protein
MRIALVARDLPPVLGGGIATNAREGPRRASTRGSVEPAGYALLALALLVLLAREVTQVDRFYLDEWVYRHAAQALWEQPTLAFGEIPNWARGPQQLYPLLLAPFWGLLATPAAFAVTHLLNAVLLVSAIVPAALLARRSRARAPPCRARRRAPAGAGRR